MQWMLPPAIVIPLIPPSTVARMVLTWLGAASTNSDTAHAANTNGGTCANMDQSRHWLLRDQRVQQSRQYYLRDNVNPPFLLARQVTQVLARALFLLGWLQVRVCMLGHAAGHMHTVLGSHACFNGV